MTENIGYHDRISILAIVGPTAVGKTAIIRYLIAEYPDVYHEIGSFTTRARREDEVEGEYEFITTEEAEALIDSGEVVQVFQHPVSGAYYGSLKHHYDAEKINVGTFLAKSVDEFQAMHESEIAVVGIRASHDKWMQRVDKRYPVGNPDREGRLREAELCFAWLEEGEYFTITNDAPNNRPAAEKVHERMKNIGMA